MKKLLWFLLAALCLAPVAAKADTTTSGSVGLILISTASRDSTGRSWGDKINNNFQIVSSTMNQVLSAFSGVETSTTALKLTISNTNYIVNSSALQSGASFYVQQGSATSMVASTFTVGTAVVYPDGSRQTTAPGASQWMTAGNDIYNSNTGNVGIGTTAPLVKAHVFQSAGTSGPQFRVSTGTTKLLEVNGSSISFGVPLYLADGSTITRANIRSQVYISSFGGSNIASFGTSNTKIVVMNNSTGNGPFLSSGTDIDWTSNAVAGSSFTIKTPGQYSISYSFSETANQQYGISVNSTELTTNFQSIIAGNRFCGTFSSGTGSDNVASHACKLLLNTGDVVRFHAQGGTAGGATTKLNFFDITKDSD